jgi:C4-dicarboxylate transporter, DctM subunit
VTASPHRSGCPTAHKGFRADKGPLKEAAIGMMPFLGMMIVLLGLLIYFPDIALWLPNRIFRQ